MLSKEEIVRRMQDRKLKIISEETGIHVNTLSLIKNGKTTDMMANTLIRLSEYFEQRP